jgi:preprotein translocase subunit SecD
MNDDLEPRLRGALHSGSLPPAPASLLDTLQRVPEAPVRLQKRRGAGPILGLFAAAAILVLASAVALTGGSTPRPGPTAGTPGPSAAVGVPGLHLEYTAQTVNGVPPTPADMAAIASILRARIDPMGVAGATVTTKDLGVIVDLPGVADSDAETVRKVLGQTGQVAFVPLGDTQVSVGQAIDLAIFPPLIAGDQIAKATVGTDQGGLPTVEFVLTADGTRLFGDYTASHIGNSFAITLDGVVVSAPIIQSGIANGDVLISGGGATGFSAADAQPLAAIIGSGPLPFPIALTSSSAIDHPSAEPSVGVVSSGPSGLHLEFAPVAAGPGVADSMTKMVAVLQARIAGAGVVGATVEAQGTDRLIVELPGVTSFDDPVVDVVSRTGRVNLVERRPGQVSYGSPTDPTIDPPLLPEGSVESVTYRVEQAGAATFDLTLTPDAASAFTGYAAAHLGSSNAIVLDGNILLVPVTLRALTDDVLTVTADGTVVDPSVPGGRAILTLLEAGPLPFDLKRVSTQVVLEPKPSAP